MKQKKWLFRAASGMVATILLTLPAYAAEPNITITDNAPSGSIYQLQPEAEKAPVPNQKGTTTPYPIDIQLSEQSSRSFLYKTYTVAADYAPDQLVEDPFSQGGYRFRFSEIIQRDSTPGSTGKPVSQTKSVESATDDRAALLALLALLGDKLPYSDADGYKGELSLVPESLSVTETGKESYSYTVTDTKYIEDLENKDWALIPKTTQKNGLPLALQDVDWQTEGYNEASISYTAIAKYSAVASGTKTSGYLATGTFTGEAVKQTAGKNTYTIVYEGEQIVVPFNFAPIIIAGAVVARCIVAAVVLWRLRRNVTIYTLQQGVPELYAKVRVSPKNPVLDLSRITDAGVRLVFDKRFVKSLYDQKVFVIGRFTNYRINITGSLVQELPAQQKEEASASQEENTPNATGGEED